MITRAFKLPVLLLRVFIIALYAILLMQCSEKPSVIKLGQWETTEIILHSESVYTNPYTDIDVWAVFTNEKGDSIRRPAFWNGENNWVIRFTTPDSTSRWRYETYASKAGDKGLNNITGEIHSRGTTTSNSFLKHGLLKMSTGKRNVVHADGTPFMMIGDTPWAIPFRATYEQVHEYARDRREHGFNTALLMTVQPDRYAEGPDRRDTLTGFERAFADLKDGHLNELQPRYFNYLDSLVNILLENGVVPVYQPVFHGFGWKGKTVLGTTADPDEYARYCRYLVARYGSKPAMYLVSADGDGLSPGVRPGGEMVEQWDDYDQPTGIHYNPCDNWFAPWAAADSTPCFHYNRSWQADPWLDFQWAQSGHDGKHVTYKVSEMYNNKPVKAVANGEPTYEGMQNGKVGLGWWQGEEAWTQLMHGGTMGVVYGAAALWQWKLTPDEEGWGEWASQDKSWKEAMQMEGRKYVGYLSKAFKGFDFADMEKRSDLEQSGKPLLAKEGKFYVSYLAKGGELTIKGIPKGLPYYWFDPKTGNFISEGTVSGEKFSAPVTEPIVFIAGKRSE